MSNRISVQSMQEWAAKAFIRSVRVAEDVHRSIGARIFNKGRPLAEHLRQQFEWTAKDGTKFIISTDSYIDLLIATERFESNILDEVAALLDEGDWAVDLGANVGGVTTRIARQVGRTGGVLAFEPSPDVVERLRNNLKLNGLDNVEVIERAAVAVPGSLKFFLPPHANLGTASAYDEASNQGGEIVEVLGETVDSHWEAAGRPNIQLVKMDIQGGEMDALRGMEKMLAKCRPAIIFEYDREIAKAAGWSLSDVARFLVGFDYRAFVSVGGPRTQRGHISLQKVIAADLQPRVNDFLVM